MKDIDCKIGMTIMFNYDGKKVVRKILGKQCVGKKLQLIVSTYKCFEWAAVCLSSEAELSSKLIANPDTLCNYVEAGRVHPIIGFLKKA